MSERAEQVDVAGSDPNPAGRLFRFSERSERTLVDGMRDLDEIMIATKRLYPDHTWSRGDLLLLFFLDDIGDRLEEIAAQSTDGE